jgi:hypothetical protein
MLHRDAGDLGVSADILNPQINDQPKDKRHA